MVSHNTDHPSALPMFPALKLMERQFPPLKYGREPYWRAPATPASERVYVPVWEWTNPHEFAPGQAVTVLDVNGAYLSALGSTKIAHSHLRHTGKPRRLPDKREVRPGYYLVTVPYWGFANTVVHPLGNSTRVELENTLWITAPTLTLLLEQEDEGHLGFFEILDSFTADVDATFKDWAGRLRTLRESIMDRIGMAQTETARLAELDRYDALKRGYSSALSMMLTGEKCATHRPDWTHTIHAQHAAATWRKAWRYSKDHPVIAMGDTDTISVLSADLPDALNAAKPAFRYDPTGRQMGALKPKEVTVTGAFALAPGPAAFLAIDEEWEDVL